MTGTFEANPLRDEGFAGWAATADLDAEPRERVGGRLRYAIDTELPGMAFGAIVRSPVAAGRLAAVDVGAAEGVAGVVRVISGADVAAAGLAGARFGSLGDQPILATERVTHVGEPVAIVVAETAETARRAAKLVRLEVTESTPVLTADEALAEGAPIVREGRPDNVLSRWARSHGDVEAARARSARVFRARFSSPAAQQASLEPHVCLATWRDGRLEVWSTSQSPSRATEDLATLFGLEPGTVAVRVPPLGGGYGGKNQTKLEPLVAFAARATGRPVKVVNDRADEFVTVTKHAASVEIESGVDAAGRFTFRTATIRWSAGAYALSSVAVARAGGLAVLGPYRIPAASVESTMAWTNVPPAGSFRGLGVSQAAWAGEQQVDEIARAIEADPVDFRRANLVRSGERLWTGERVADAHWVECLDAAVGRLEVARSDGVSAAASATPAAVVRHGTGVAVAMKHTITPSRSEAEVALLADGCVEVRTSAVDMGQGVEVVLARIAADALALPVDRIVVARPDTARTPFDMTTSSSRATFAVGNAVEAAARDLVDRAIEAASIAAGIPPDRLDWGPDGIREARTGWQRTLRELAAAGPGDGLVGRATFVNEPERDAETGEPVSSSHWHQGAVAVDASVDVETGIVRVEALAGAAWAGRVVNGPGARLQNEGNLTFGLGPALSEALEFPAGSPSATDLLDYRLTAIRDLPWALETVALEGSVGDGVDGHPERHGLGESLIPGVAPALANAVADATGARVRRLPISPERLLAVLDE
ncbi:MAG TPA: xanthine dehydrogenase family protein molybdopterin-binding subunit [Candidatus Limnocylindrales bacterium]|nr:xanthine dehydrogenase family protein molybdopterin-binding subunit [Candidatus Limnocylindrales bacterium]